MIMLVGVGRHRRDARLEQFRAIATRFDRLAVRYHAGLVTASLVRWFREPAS
ncbi:hypothetical protein ACIBTZ_18875 [Micromonospora sp. NPDC049460]|uniref:hypothetical protein n=1 Tax=Micromonospora sp. NPDC049460 TaxID=3364272 RepID=UPI0037AF6675